MDWPIYLPLEDTALGEVVHVYGERTASGAIYLQEWVMAALGLEVRHRLMFRHDARAALILGLPETARESLRAAYALGGGEATYRLLDDLTGHGLV